MDPERIRSRLEDLTEVLKSSLTRERFLYTSCYCEENVYQAINELKTNENFATYSLVRDGLLEMHTIFIINPIKAFRCTLDFGFRHFTSAHHTF
ncbi:hypothetical protein DSO57_1014787 [Entomophthora muscae]|uniref:Uncharacterized protein n=1 Tax=Entomophthora muscae TaxID=34485 RepID=A0ACC2UEQ9_9FUNG|nr:hypothetical protein DSO57_1014787 [Entomophthora muscae]